MPELALAGIALLAVALAWLNGLHDASNAVSTTIATRTLSERGALAFAAVLNLLGALLGLDLAAGSHVVIAGLGADLAGVAGTRSVLIVLASALAASILWGVVTWWRGMPSSTWHAMYGGIAGAALALEVPVLWNRELGIVALWLLLSPLLGGLLTFGLVHALSRATTRSSSLGNRHLRAAQTVSAGAVAAGHGMSDVVIPWIAIAMAMSLSGHGGVPWWAGVLLALALAAGTLAGGRRIIRTLVTRLTDLSTAQGLAAETSAAAVLVVASFGFGAPVSTSHTITAGIVSSGLAIGPRSVRWPVVGHVLLTWILTPLAAAACAASLALLLQAATP